MPRRDPPFKQVIFTCEHGGNDIPPQYAHLFQGEEELLASHRGWDPGALKLATYMSEGVCDAQLISSTTTRLLVDLNRSLDNPSLFSKLTRNLSDKDKQRILKRYYHPYRAKVENLVARTIARHGWACHISLHSFTPELNGKVRTADVGILFDPARPREKRLADFWVLSMQRLPVRKHLRVKRNYPYRGTSDGLTTYLRTKFSARKYVGIEVEVNQAQFFAGGKTWENVEDQINGTLFLALLRTEEASWRPK